MRVFASPRSMILAVTVPPSSILTMMLLGLMSRWTSFCLWIAANPPATCVAISSANFTSSRPGAFDKILERFPLDKLHRVKVVLTGSAQMENRGNIRVTNARRRAGFA